MVACRMTNENYQHQPVMLTEVLHGFAIKPDGIYVDATFGRGGHSQAILGQLSSVGRLIAIDKDLDAIAYAQQAITDKRFSIHHGSFATLKNILDSLQLFGKIDGILFDLGVSSPQLDNPARGFSFKQTGKLDMRMDLSSGVDAATWIEQMPEQEIARVLWEYGEERFSRRIARAIIGARQVTPITTTQQLSEIVSAAIPSWEKGKHPATRSFQAIRIAINHELDDLQTGLEQALEALNIGGRLLVISFHSLEDRIVKHFIQHHERGDRFPAKLPVKHSEHKPRLKRFGRAIKPSAAEVSGNPRSRSAVLRIAEKQS